MRQATGELRTGEKKGIDYRALVKQIDNTLNYPIENAIGVLDRLTAMKSKG